MEKVEQKIYKLNFQLTNQVVFHDNNYRKYLNNTKRNTLLKKYK